MQGYSRGRLFVLVAVLLALVSGGLLAQPAAAANNGYNISTNSSPNTRPAINISPDNSRLCAAWSTFDVNPDAYVSVYTFASNSWSTPVNVSQNPGENTQDARCAIDGAGTLHAVWSEGATKRIQYRSLPAGADPSNLGNWSAVQTISTETDAQAVDIAAQFNDTTGRVWIAYTAQNGAGGYDIHVRGWTPATGWSGAATVSSAGSATAHFPRIAVANDGSVHVAYWQGAGGGARYVYMDPNGNWSQNIQLPGAGGAIQPLGLAVNRVSGDVHVVYSTGPDNGRVVYYVKKTGSAGLTFSAPVALTGAGNYVVPRIAWSPTGRLVMVSDLEQGTNSSLTYNISDDNGASWNGAGFLTDGAVSTLIPWVTADNTGTAYIVYWNNRDNTIYFTTTGGAPAPAPVPAPAPGPAPGPPFTAWNTLGGILTDSPAAAGLGANVYVFAKGSDNALYMRYSNDGGTSYTPWGNLGGILTAAPAAASFQGRIYVFAKGSDNALYYKRSDPDGVFRADWVNLGGILTAPPAAASDGTNLYVFARGTDNALYYKRTADGLNFGNWYNQGGILTSAPAAASFQNRVYVFVRGSDNALYAKNTTGPDTFSAWSNLGGILTAAPAAASYTPPGGQETLFVFAKGTDDTLYDRFTQDGANYNGWVSLGGQMIGPPAAAGANGQLFVYVRGKDNALWERHTTR